MATVSLTSAILHSAQIYAEAGIGFYWRLELETRPHLIVSALTHGKFRQTLTALSGEAASIEDPFPIEIDLAALTASP
ncbi:hypothetical protein ACFPJ1_38785 [Kribbella qitaiheensis]|uniref:hypothetical protein n=1 Tax=Kribbella qitaiheensis TaxID=1544730 RepID=UPI00361948AB